MSATKSILFDAEPLVGMPAFADLGLFFIPAPISVVQILEGCRHLAGCRALCIEKQDFVIHAAKTGLLFFDGPGFEASGVITRYADIKPSFFTQQRFSSRWFI